MKDYKEYKMATGWKYFILISAPGLIALFLWVGLMPFSGDEFKVGLALFLVPLSIAMIVLMILGMIETVKSSLRIYEDRFLKVNVFKNKEYKFSDIKGFRTNDQYIVIFNKKENNKSIKVSNYFGKTEELIKFLSTRFTNIDAKEYAEEEVDLHDNKAFGRTKEEREYNIKRTKRLTKGLNYSSWIFGIWYFIFPQPYELLTIINLALPIIGLVTLIRLSGLIRVIKIDNSPYPSLTTTLSIPPLILMVRALIDYELFNYSSLWIPAILLTATFSYLIRYGAKSELTFNKPWEYAIVYPFLISTVFIYTIFSLISINCTFDNTTPDIYEAEVLDKRINDGKNSTTYYLKLDKWGPQDEIDEVSVSKRRYLEVSKGDKIDVNLKKGLFDISWIIVRTRNYATQQ